MLEGQLVRYTKPNGENVSARILQEVGGGVLISYVEERQSHWQQ